MKTSREIVIKLTIKHWDGTEATFEVYFDKDGWCAMSSGEKDEVCLKALGREIDWYYQEPLVSQ